MTDEARVRPASPRSARVAALLAYGGLIVGGVIAFELIRLVGARIGAPAPAAGAPLFGAGETVGRVDTLLHVLLALVVVIVTARTVGTLFRHIHQPPVVGEILAGILLGPSLLGRLAPAWSAFILPPAVAPFLGVLAQVGVILYMFLVGLEMDPSLLRQRGQATVGIAHASIVVPFLLGGLLALALYPRLSSSDVPFTCFALFVGVSMSVTAFPVLARILTDRDIHRTQVGAVALTCAAVGDVSAWVLLAFVVSVVQAKMAGALLTFVLTLGFIALMALVVRPVMVRLALVYGNRGRLTQGVIASIFVALLLSSLATDLIGIHAVFGAFALGAVIPHDSGMARELTDRLEDLVVVLLLPAFFAFTGLRTEIGLVSGGSQWLACAAIVVVASVGKFGGTALAARATGFGWRDASALGVLMNTRGLMELIVLDIGLELRVISATLFAMLVLMAVATTMATTPLLHLVTRGRRLDEPLAEPAPVARRGGVLLPLSNPVGMRPLVDLALAATRREDPSPRVLALVRRPGGGVRSGLREIEQREAPRAPLLLEAADYARSRGARIDVQAMWTDDPASDILSVAREPQIGWILLGFHRAVFGADLLGGVVREILVRAGGEHLDVGVVIHGSERPVDRVVAVVDASDDGRAALDLAARVALGRGAALQAVVAPANGGEPEPALQALLKDAARSAGRWLHTDVLLARSREELEKKATGALTIIGHRLTDEIGLPLGADPERCVVVVRGGAAGASARALPAGAARASSG